MCWQSDEGARSKARLFDLEMKAFSGGFDMQLLNVIISVHPECWSIKEDERMPVQGHWVPVGEVTTEVAWAEVDNEQGTLEVCDSSSVPLGLMCAGTGGLMTALRGSKPKLSFCGVHSNTKALKKTHNRELPLYMIQRGFDTPNSLMEIIVFFHLSDILEMPLAVVVFESKANMRLVCLQP